MSKAHELNLTQVKVEASKNARKLTEVNVGKTNLTGVKVEGKNGRMSSSRNSEFVYVNSAYVGSVSDVNNLNNVNTVSSVSEGRRTNRTPAAPVAPVTEVYREQYWTCSRWPYTQRVLAIAVGVLLGALIGLMLSLLLGDDDDSVIGPIFTRQHVAPN